MPLIVLTGCVDADAAQTYTHQVLDQRKVFDPITKASFTLSAGAASVISDKAVTIALEGRPGPVHIDVPISVADAPAADVGLHRAPNAATAPAGPALDAARAALASAKRPLIVAGVDAVHEGASTAVLKAAETLGAPVITTYKGKGLIPEDHPLSVGGAGLSPKADAILLPAVQEADVILAIGYDPIEMRPGWREIWDPARVNVVDITAEPNHQYMHQATVNIVGHCGATLARLTDGIPARDTWADGAVATTKAALAQAFSRDEEWGAAVKVAHLSKYFPQQSNMRDDQETIDQGIPLEITVDTSQEYADDGIALEIPVE